MRKFFIPILITFIGLSFFSMFVLNRVFTAKVKHRIESRIVHAPSHSEPGERVIESVRVQRTPAKPENKFLMIISYSKELISLATGFCGFLLVLRQLRSKKREVN